MKSFLVRFPIVSYVILAFTISWTLWLPVVFSGPEMLVAVSVFHILGGLGPFAAALIMLKFSVDHEESRTFKQCLFRWRFPLKWYALVLFMPFGLLVFSYLVLFIIGGSFTGVADLPPLWMYPLLFLYMTVLGGGLEEPGWRGYALPRLLARFNPLTASLVLGIIWAFWHLPLFWSQSTSQGNTPLGLFVLSGVALSVIFTWSYLYTRGSTFLIIILHGGVNTSLNWFPMGENNVQPFLPFTMVVVLIAILLAICSPALRGKNTK